MPVTPLGMRDTIKIRRLSTDRFQRWKLRHKYSKGREYGYLNVSNVRSKQNICTFIIGNIGMWVIAWCCSCMHLVVVLNQQQQSSAFSDMVIYAQCVKAKIFKTFCFAWMYCLIDLCSQKRNEIVPLISNICKVLFMREQLNRKW